MLSEKARVLFLIYVFAVIIKKGSAKKFVEGPRNQTVEGGEKVELYCVLDYSPRKCRWKQNGTTISDLNPHFRIFKEGKFCNLIIDRAIFPDHEGAYQCEVPHTYDSDKQKHDKGIFSTIGYLTLAPTKQKIISNPESKEVIEGNTVKLTCGYNLKADKCKWYHSRNEVFFQRGKYQLQPKKHHCSLEISNVNMADAGYYWCEIFNGDVSLQSDMAYVTVKVKFSSRKAIRTTSSTTTTATTTTTSTTTKTTGAVRTINTDGTLEDTQNTKEIFGDADDTLTLSTEGQPSYTEDVTTKKTRTIQTKKTADGLNYDRLLLLLTGILIVIELPLAAYIGIEFCKNKKVTKYEKVKMNKPSVQY